MRIGFMGLGKLGLPCALAVEARGHEVCGCDPDPGVAAILRSRVIPYQEVEAQEHLNRSLIELVPLDEVVRRSELIFVTIQTPHADGFDGTKPLTDERADFDYSFLAAGVRDLVHAIDLLGEDRIVVIVSTVLPGTLRREILPLLSPRVKLCYNPFFIAMGTTIPDFLHPEFVLLGAHDAAAAATVRAFYRTITTAECYTTSLINAELIKVTYNTFIGMKIAFANTLMEVCHKVGADCDSVTAALGLAHKRILSTAYLSGGMGDGGGCHPRDNLALSCLARKLDLSFDLFEASMLARERQTAWLATLMEGYRLPKVILGKAFKPETRLTFGSPALLLRELLAARGHQVTMWDPHVDAGPPPDFGPSVFLVGTRHPEFVEFAFPAGSVVLDPWRYIPDRGGVTVVRIGRATGADPSLPR